jgi:hypothetical protein
LAIRQHDNCRNSCIDEVARHAVCIPGSGKLKNLLPLCLTIVCAAFFSVTALADLNGDGHADIVVSNAQSANRVCLGDGNGGFSPCSDVSDERNKSQGVALGDLDDDGDLDAIFANEGQRNRVCLGDGQGGFSSCADVDNTARLTTDVALGDLDDDGHIDAVFTNAFGIRNQVCLGIGNGTFSTCDEIGQNGRSTNDLALADLDGDGHLDGVFVNYDQANRVCLGNGNGGFPSCEDIPGGARLSFDVALGDLNGDGDLDAVFVNESQANQVCLGNGNGTFTNCTDMGGGSRRSISSELADLNGDNVPDVVIGNGGGISSLANEANQVCLGNGTGGFQACNDLSGAPRTTRGQAIMDLNGDGHIDVVFANTNQRNRVCLGNGSGGFSSCSDVSGDERLSIRVATVSESAPPQPDPFEIDAGLNGNWWNGLERNGEGVQVEVSDGGGGSLILVATIYSYDTMGNQIFLIAVGTVNGDTAEVDVFITEGGQWGDGFDPSLVSESPWGTGRFTAMSCDAIDMSLTPNAQHQGMGYTNLSYELIRLTAPLIPCPATGGNSTAKQVNFSASQPMAETDLGAGLNGNWWNGPDRNGEGAQIELSNGGGGSLILVATLYSYFEGEQIFLIAVGTASGATADVEVFITAGGLWGNEYNPELVRETPWGTGTFTAQGCELISMSLMPNTESQVMGYTDIAYDLTRLTTPTVPCPIVVGN